ncbi:MAG TPA: glutamine--tRNA ligase/YqeY domain fusion protein [Polyangiaceae bacterium]
MPSAPNPDSAAPADFLREIVKEDLASGRHVRVHTRFPPEPNGYLHIGHAKSICLNFGIARELGGLCNLRFDDTNPETEDVEYVESIQTDVRWLGFDWEDRLYFASDYFERLYEFAEELIRAGKAYVCSLNEEQIREYRGTISEPGRPSPYRDRSAEENLDLFRRMRAGEFPDGAHVLRAKIDMASTNMKMRDPLLYRIRHAEHYRRGSAWCIYPFYDFTHCLSDALESITHSICTLEFESNRELYDWVIENVSAPARPRQYEFARLNLTYTVMSKRRLLELVEKGHVSGWDDPRMLTLSGLRRRGVTPEAVRGFCERIGVSKNNSTVDMALFEHVLREDLNERAPRVLCVLRPLKVVIENWPEGRREELDAPYWPHDVPLEGSRPLTFSREIYVERSDFMEQPSRDFFRLSPGGEVRLRHAYVIRCTGVVKDERGEVIELRCSFDPETRGDRGHAGGARKVKGTIHWVSADDSLPVEVRLYDRLFKSEFPGSEGESFIDDLNPESLVRLSARAERGLGQARAGDRFQFERHGFFFVDPIDSTTGAPVFSRIVALKDAWAKLSSKAMKAPSAAAPSARLSTQRQPAEAKANPDKSSQKPGPKVEVDPAAAALRDAHGLSIEEAKVLASDPDLRALFEAVFSRGVGAKAVASFIVRELRGALGERRATALPFDAAALAALVRMMEQGTITPAVGRDVLGQMLETGQAPDAIVEARGLRQIADAGELLPLIERVLSEHAETVDRYRAGNKNLFGALVGMVMKATGGKANAKLVNELLRQKLG